MDGWEVLRVSLIHYVSTYLVMHIDFMLCHCFVTVEANFDALQGYKLILESAILQRSLLFMGDNFEDLY